MTLKTTATPSTMDDEHARHNRETEARIKQDVAEYGYHMGLIADDGYQPGFAYTIGLWETYQHPEVIIIGLRQEAMVGILTNLGQEISKGKRYEAGATYEGVIDRYEITSVSVNPDNYPYYMGYGMWYYKGRDYPAVQLVWPDLEAHWPWEEDFNPKTRFSQPLLDRNMDFKFKEERNLGVFTTHHVLDGKPVLHVFHNENGDWQFHSEDAPQSQDGRVVSLEQMLKLDPTLNEIFYLNYGYSASRDEVDGPWVLYEPEPELNNRPGRKTKSKWHNKLFPKRK